MLSRNKDEAFGALGLLQAKSHLIVAPKPALKAVELVATPKPETGQHHHYETNFSAHHVKLTNVRSSGGGTRALPTLRPLLNDRLHEANATGVIEMSPQRHVLFHQENGRAIGCIFLILLLVGATALCVRSCLKPAGVIEPVVDAPLFQGGRGNAQFEGRDLQTSETEGSVSKKSSSRSWLSWSQA